MPRYMGGLRFRDFEILDGTLRVAAEFCCRGHVNNCAQLYDKFHLHAMNFVYVYFITRNTGMMI